ncbi:hypothetical protein CW745_13895 [Psychromonas sp. psych-6C06]|uniref:phage tail protein n=1 Tax=Psychromonas sp. psych-6C06 TaxID=2058089 RepID=UPI000C34CF77|nr:phage tail protein [Psychromonas sp. psych-6C06]PKF60619.1 hypothetical protein CW745_13895 [Psychromonas sp. psych-6C06]
MFEDNLKRFQNELSAIPAHVDKRAVKAINATARKAKNLAKKGIGQQVNLAPSYINSKLRIITPATPGNLTAVIGAESRGVLLTRFDAQQVTKSVKNKSRSKGDKRRGLAPGQKSKGVTIKVKRKGSRKFLPAFFLPLKNGNGVNGMALAVRTGKGRGAIKVLHGPSVSQVFKTVKADIAPQVSEMAVNALLDELELL